MLVAEVAEVEATTVRWGKQGGPGPEHLEEDEEEH
jgi:hypothetical protein